MQNIMERKHREQDLKLQQAGQQSSKQEVEKTTHIKEEEVSQSKSSKGDLRLAPAKPHKPMGMIMHTKTPNVLQELHQQQLNKLKKQRMAPILLVLEPQFTQNITYGNIPVIVPRSVGMNLDLNLASRMRSILTAVNTITIATSALVEVS